MSRPVAVLFPRGVHVEPYMGENGELILIAVTSQGRRAAPAVLVPHGADRLAAADALWDLLDEVDPDIRSKLKVV